MDMDRFMPHGMCFLWQWPVLSLHIASDALIALAYFSIPLILVWFIRRRADLPFRAVFWMFALFIVSCGMTHVFDIIVIWKPVYWLQGAVKAVTALSSIGTALLMVPLLPRALTLRSPLELERLNEQLQSALADREQLLERYEREHHIAVTLQNASLGEPPANLGPLELSAMYQPGEGDLEIGGDWYDAFLLADNRVVVSVGDVAGKGLYASVIMAKMRQAIRVAAQMRLAPAAILDAADRALRSEHRDEVVTAFVGIIDHTESVIAFANAGHPAPLLRDAGGSIHELRADGLPLGLRDLTTPQSGAVEPFPVGATLVLYTDGLTEATHDYGDGERRLRAAVADPSLANASQAAQAVAAAVLHEGSRDDVAILVARNERRNAPAGRWRFDAADAAEARRTRDAVIALLAANGAHEDDLHAAATIYGELIANAHSHAGTGVDVLLEWSAGHPVLHVLDEGDGYAHVPRPQAELAESGRGLFIVEALAAGLTVERRPLGGSHARAVLPLSRTPAGPRPAPP